MSTINQLPTVSALTSADKALVYSSENGDARKASIGTLRDFVQANMTDADADTLTLREYLRVTPVTVANLPVASAAIIGARAAVTDATQTLTAGIGATAAGGGANVVPVFCNGVNWIIG